MPLYLKSEPQPTLPGLTLYSDSTLGQWAKPTGVYVTPSVNLDAGVVNVVLWLHGWYVPKIEALFNSDRSAVRRQVLASGKSVVLVAPYLGNGGQGESSSYDTKLSGHWGEQYLDQVLGALSVMRDPDTYEAPWKSANQSLTTPGQTLHLGKLVIACHSGGGEAMRNLVGTLGRYAASLKECWGFDCLYHANVKYPPDDANFWYKWTTGSDGRPLYISYGKSTVPQSVKLFLMGQGFANGDGARLDPQGAKVPRLNVTLGIDTARPVEELMGLDVRPANTATKTTPTLKPGNKFVEQLASTLSKNAGWPADLMEMHYRIARDGLLERSKGFF